jgi:hypothetical protein
MNYQIIYNQIIERAQNRKLDGYKERHHIIPKCMGGSNDKTNLVELTAREHFICHRLLCEIYPKNKKLIYSVWVMATGFRKSHNSDYKVSSRVFEYLRTNFSNTIRNVPKPKNFMTPELKQKISSSNKGVTRNVGRIASDETKQKMSLSHKGNKHSQITKDKISQKNKGNKHLEKTKHMIKDKKLGKPTKKSQSVFQYDLNGNFIKEWNKIKEASKFIGKEKDTSSITSCCRGKQKTAFGFIWKYN